MDRDRNTRSRAANDDDRPCSSFRPPNLEKYHQQHQHLKIMPGVWAPTTLVSTGASKKSNTRKSSRPVKSNDYYDDDYDESMLQQQQQRVSSRNSQSKVMEPSSSEYHKQQDRIIHEKQQAKTRQHRESRAYDNRKNKTPTKERGRGSAHQHESDHNAQVSSSSNILNISDTTNTTEETTVDYDEDMEKQFQLFPEYNGNGALSHGHNKSRASGEQAGKPTKQSREQPSYRKAKSLISYDTSQNNRTNKNKSNINIRSHNSDIRENKGYTWHKYSNQLLANLDFSSKPEKSTFNTSYSETDSIITNEISSIDGASIVPQQQLQRRGQAIHTPPLKSISTKIKSKGSKTTMKMDIIHEKDARSCHSNNDVSEKSSVNAPTITTNLNTKTRRKKELILPEIKSPDDESSAKSGSNKNTDFTRLTHKYQQHHQNKVTKEPEYRGKYRALRMLEERERAQIAKEKESNSVNPFILTQQKLQKTVSKQSEQLSSTQKISSLSSEVITESKVDELDIKKSSRDHDSLDRSFTSYDISSIDGAAFSIDTDVAITLEGTNGNKAKHTPSKHNIPKKKSDSDESLPISFVSVISDFDAIPVVDENGDDVDDDHLMNVTNANIDTKEGIGNNITGSHNMFQIKQQKSKNSGRQLRALDEEQEYLNQSGLSSHYDEFQSSLEKDQNLHGNTNNADIPQSYSSDRDASSVKTENVENKYKKKTAHFAEEFSLRTERVKNAIDRNTPFSEESSIKTERIKNKGRIVSTYAIPTPSYSGLQNEEHEQTHMKQYEELVENPMKSSPPATTNTRYDVEADHYIRRVAFEQLWDYDTEKAVNEDEKETPTKSNTAPPSSTLHPNDSKHIDFRSSTTTIVHSNSKNINAPIESVPHEESKIIPNNDERKIVDDPKRKLIESVIMNQVSSGNSYSTPSIVTCSKTKTTKVGSRNKQSSEFATMKEQNQKEADISINNGTETESAVETKKEVSTDVDNSTDYNTKSHVTVDRKEQTQNDKNLSTSNDSKSIPVVEIREPSVKRQINNKSISKLYSQVKSKLDQTLLNSHLPPYQEQIEDDAKSLESNKDFVYDDQSGVYVLKVPTVSKSLNQSFSSQLSSGSHPNNSNENNANMIHSPLQARQKQYNDTGNEADLNITPKVNNKKVKSSLSPSSVSSIIRKTIVSIRGGSKNDIGVQEKNNFYEYNAYHSEEDSGCDLDKIPTSRSNKIKLFKSRERNSNIAYEGISVLQSQSSIPKRRNSSPDGGSFHEDTPNLYDDQKTYNGYECTRLELSILFFLALLSSTCIAYYSSRESFSQFIKKITIIPKNKASTTTDYDFHDHGFDMNDDLLIGVDDDIFKDIPVINSLPIMVLPEEEQEQDQEEVQVEKKSQEFHQEVTFYV